MHYASDRILLTRTHDEITKPQPIQAPATPSPPPDHINLSSLEYFPFVMFPLLSIDCEAMFYSVDIGYDLCGPQIANPGTILLFEARNYVFHVVTETTKEDTKEEGTPVDDKPPFNENSGAWKAIFTDDKNLAKIALNGPAGEEIPGKLFFNFAWSVEVDDAISAGKAPSDGGEAVVIEGTLDEAVHRAALMILKKGRQGNFCINIFGHEELPPGVPLSTTLTMEQAEEMQSDDSHYVDARVMVNNMELVLFQNAHDGEDEEKVLRRRNWKYGWWEKGALPKDYSIYEVRKKMP